MLKLKPRQIHQPRQKNEILSIMALSVLRSISNEVAGKYYSFMIDETTDVEQMVFCLRYVDDNVDACSRRIYWTIQP